MSIEGFAKRVLGLTLLVVALASAPAVAAEVDFTNVAYAPVSGLTSIPVGHADFCKRYPTECGVNAKVIEAVTLTQKKWQQLLSVNSHFNTTIVPETDEQLYHVAEFWTYPNGYGDCEDIALAKRKALMAAGWPASALLMTVGRQANGEGHAVLMVRTDRGDFILDNQDSTIHDWRDSPYHLLKRQSQTNSAEWVGINDGRAAVIVAGK